MRHMNYGRKLGRTGKHRRALWRNLATEILRRGRVRTTVPKAKEVRRYVERMITLGKRGHLHARRMAASFLRDRTVVSKVFGEYAQSFKERAGGYTRIIKLGPRLGDCAEMAYIELIGFEPAAVHEKAKGKKGPAKDEKSKDKGKAKEAADETKGKGPERLKGKESKPATTAAPVQKRTRASKVD
jgi:large subunit ribosomal protein L17